MVAMDDMSEISFVPKQFPTKTQLKAYKKLKTR